MAERDAIKDRKKRFIGEDSSSTKMSRDELQAAKDVDDVGFLDSLTDTESILSGVLSLGALAAGSPEAAAAIAGLDVLGSPKEMQRASDKKERGIQTASANLKSDMRADTQEDYQEVQQNLLIYQTNPAAYITTAIMGGATDEQISRSLGMPEEMTMAWAKALEKTEQDKFIDGTVTKLFAAAETADSEKDAIAAYEEAFGWKLPNVDPDVRTRLATALAKGNTDFMDIIPPGTFTGMSMTEARRRYETNSGDVVYILDALVEVKNTIDIAQELDEELLSVSAEIAQIMADNYRVFPDGTATAISVEKAISLIPDPHRKELGRKNAAQMGFAGTARDNEDLFSKTYTDMQQFAAKANKDYALTWPDRPQLYSPQDVLKMTQEATSSTRHAANNASFLEGQALHGSVTKAVEAIGYPSGSLPGIAVQSQALVDAQMKLDDPDASDADIMREAERLILSNRARYEAIAQDALVEGDPSSALSMEPSDEIKKASEKAKTTGNDFRTIKQ